MKNKNFGVFKKYFFLKLLKNENKNTFRTITNYYYYFKE